MIGNDSLRLNVSTEWHTGDHGGMSNFPATDIHFSSFQMYLNFFLIHLFFIIHTYFMNILELKYILIYIYKSIIFLAFFIT